MDELAILGRISEGVDALLRYLDPARCPQRLADFRMDLFEARDGHGRLFAVM